MGAYFGVSTIFIFCLLGFSANAEVFSIGSSSGSDITKALLKAFTSACQSPSPSKVVIPKGEFKLGEIEMRGPCKAPVEITLQGTVKADGNAIQGKEKWVVFGNINGFKLNGGGAFDGEGNAAWRVNNCHQTFNCKKLPISIRFDFVENAEIKDISSIDAKNFHINVLGAKNMTMSNIKITAPEDSPNTDGIHLGRSDGVKILNSFISTGDDCISVGDGTSNLHVEKVTCGPGHGISVGSLGRYGKEQDVSGIRVVNCTLQETDNGLRIKTWPSAACSTTASDIHFEDIIVKNVTNPILIDQEYCPWNQCNKKKASTIKLVNISFKNVRGTSGNKDAVKLLCSKGYPCQNVEIGDIDIKYSGADGPATFQCSNTDEEIDDDGKLHVVVRSSNAASSMISFNKSHGGGMNSSMIKPQASNITDAEIYSVSFNQTDFYAMFNASKAPSPRHGYSKSYGGAGSGRGGDVYSLQSSIGVAPRASSFNEEVFKTKKGGRSMSVPYPPPNPMFTGSTSGASEVKKNEIGGGGEQNKEMNMFVCSSSAPPISEAIARNTITRGASIDSSIDLRASLPSNDNLASEAMQSLIQNKTPGRKRHVEVDQEGKKGNDVEDGGVGGPRKQQMPPASVMTRLILIMVWRKLIRNPNTYSSLFGLAWSLVSFKWNIKMPTIMSGSISILSDAGLGMAMFSLGLFMALQPKIIACGKSVAVFAMAVRFLSGPAVIAATSTAIGLRGNLLHIAIVQAALPQGIVPFVFAKEYNVHPDILSTAVIFGMLVALPVTVLYYVLLGI